MQLGIIHIEDEPIWLHVVEAVVASTPTVIYLDRARTRAAGLALIASKRPGLVILDLRLPDGDGTEIAQILASDKDRPKLIFLTVRHDEVTLFNIRRFQVDGLVWKDTAAYHTLAEAIRRVAAGGVFFPEEVQAAESAFRRNPNAFFKLLSDRELEVMPLLARGCSDAEIASQIAVAPKTAKSHRQHIMNKLGLHKVAQLMRWALERGFGG